MAKTKHMPRCPYCSAAVKEDLMERHITETHGSPDTPPDENAQKNPKFMPIKTCRVCGKVMLTRYLKSHAQMHERLLRRGISHIMVGASEIPSEPQDTPSVLPYLGIPEAVVTCPICDHPTPRSQFQIHLSVNHPDFTICPVCDQPVQVDLFVLHLNGHNWCPVCRRPVENLNEHLSLSYEVKPAAKMTGPYLPDWKDLPLFVCAVCEQPLTSAEVLQHHEEHQQDENQAKAARLLEESQSKQPKKICPVCRHAIRQDLLKAHMEHEHPTCPYCQMQLSTRSLKTHIDRKHPGKPMLPTDFHHG